MLQNKVINKCIRCDKPRVVVKTWTENKITYSDFVCPDKECQKIVDADLKKKRDRLKIIKENSLKRRQLMLKRRSKKK